MTDPGSSLVDRPLLPLGVLFAERYRVESLLGEGGMGAVYRVHDVHLDEAVALKVLTLPSQAAVERFVEEVRIARRITHPNVARTHDLGDYQGIRYLTMELVEGEALDEVLDRSGALPAREAARLAIGIARGLEAAHGAGVVHRDLKPANVLLGANGRAVITDFGIARALERPGPGHTVGLIGTPGYMSPEQAVGATLDARSDIYALGIILYEMLTGRLPFEEADAMATVMARLRRAPTHPSKYAQIPTPLSDLVMWLLARDPSGRPSSAQQVREALEAFLAGPESNTLPTGKLSVFAPMFASERAVAVLPFRYRGPEEHGYLGEGMAEELIDTLSRTRGLKVLALGATARLAGERDPIVLGAELNVQSVVDGTVQLAGARVRITARLLAAADGEQQWSGRVDADFEDVFSLQESLGKRLAEALRVELDAAGSPNLSREAAELYLRARRLYRADIVSKVEQAVTMFDRCLEMAPDLAPALAGHAMACVRASWQAWTGDVASKIERARHSVERAEERAPDQAETHLARGMLATNTGDFAGAAAALRRALEIAPTLAEAHQYLGSLQSEAGRPREAMRRLRLALELDPDLNMARLALMRCLELEGRRDEARALLADLRDRLGERNIGLLSLELRLALYHNDRSEIERTFGLMLSEQGPLVGLMAPVLEFGLGRAPPPDLASLQQTLAERFPNPRFAALMQQVAVEVLSYAGEHEHALDVLGRLAEGVLIDVMWLERCPLLAPLRSDARYAEAAARVRHRAAALWAG